MCDPERYNLSEKKKKRLCERKELKERGSLTCKAYVKVKARKSQPPNLVVEDV